MAFVNHGMGTLAGMAMLPLVRLGGPHLGAEHLGYLVLDNPCHIGRKALSPAAGPLYVQLVQLAVVQEHLRNLELPVTGAQGLEGIGIRPFPVVEVSDEENPGSVGGIFTEHPGTIGALVKAVIDVIVHGVLQQAFPGNVLQGFRDVAVPGVNGVLVRHQPRVQLVDFFHTFIPYLGCQFFPSPFSGTPCTV